MRPSPSSPSCCGETPASPTSRSGARASKRPSSLSPDALIKPPTRRPHEPSRFATPAQPAAHLCPGSEVRVPEALPVAGLRGADPRLSALLLPPFRADLPQRGGGGKGRHGHLPDRHLRHLRGDRGVALRLRG